MPRVMCTIDNCHYWKSGNVCDANQILVTSDSLAENEHDRVDAPAATTLSTTPADSCMETCCKTFVPHDAGSHRHHTDGVIRS